MSLEIICITGGSFLTERNCLAEKSYIDLRKQLFRKRAAAVSQTTAGRTESRSLTDARCLIENRCLRKAADLQNRTVSRGAAISPTAKNSRIGSNLRE
jgi:hypothetical protein